jgi:nitrogen fixation/metabolism regulation signal transduction histidine kinase
MDGFGIGPEFLPAVLVMGIIYPAIFGGIGGWLSTKVPTVPDSSDQAREEASS